MQARASALARTHMQAHARTRALARTTDLFCPRAQLRQSRLVGANGLEAVELRSQREVGDELYEGIPECNVTRDVQNARWHVPG
jgi:hypothetical protein